MCFMWYVLMPAAVIAGVTGQQPVPEVWVELFGESASQIAKPDQGYTDT